MLLHQWPLQLKTDFEWQMLSARTHLSSAKTSGNLSPVPFGNNSMFACAHNCALTLHAKPAPLYWLHFLHE